MYIQGQRRKLGNFAEETLNCSYTEKINNSNKEVSK